MERITSAEEIHENNIRNENQPGCFTVKAQSSDRWYNLSFGAKNRMPSCECLDFRRNGLPCKHFFAVFKHFPEWQWESLPENYRNNPFLSLDVEAPFSFSVNEEPISLCEHLPQVEEPHDRQTPDTRTRDNTMNTERKVRQNQMECRSILKELTTLTYNVCDPGALDDLKTGLKPILSKFESHQLTDEQENILTTTKKITNVNSPEVNKKSSLQNNLLNKNNKPGVDNTTTYVSLPLRRKKNRFGTRVGERASIMRKNYHVDLPVDDDFQPKKKKKKTQRKSYFSNKETSTLPIAGELRSSSNHLIDRQPIAAPSTKKNNDIPENKLPGFIITSNDIITKGNAPPEIRSSSLIVDKSPMDVERCIPQDCPRNEVSGAITADLKETDMSQSKVTTFTSTKPACITVHEDSPDPLVWIKIENYDVCGANTENKLVLYEQTKTRLLKKLTWLNNVEINAGQMLLKNSFPTIGGLGDPSITGSDVIPAKSAFVQILNTGGHWVCLSTVATKPDSGIVKVFDSLYNKPSQNAIEYSARLLKHNGSTLTFLNEKVQKQRGLSDCGLFALAFATDLCHGVDPANEQYDQTVMRSHYVKCLESKAMIPFPKTTKRVPSQMTCIKTLVEIFCVCRQPNDHHQYVQCFFCKEWYHPTCVDIPIRVINSRRKWHCVKCKGSSI